VSTGYNSGKSTGYNSGKFEERRDQAIRTSYKEHTGPLRSERAETRVRVDKQARGATSMATDGAVLGVIRASRPSFRNSHDRVTFAIHASFLAAGYSLTSTGSQAASLSAPFPGNEEVGIEGWNEMDDAYAFCYTRSHDGVTKSVIVKALIMGDMVVVDAVPTGESDAKDNPEPYNLEINVYDYTTESATSKNYAEHYKNLPALVEKINSSILSKLESSPKAGNTSTSTRSKKASSGGQEATQDQPEIGFTGLHPSYSSGNQPDSSGLVYPPVPPIGVSDLFPGPGAGIYPHRGDAGIGGGMLLGPNDPRWRIGTDGVGGPQIPGGLRGVPPGARFDPFGPPGVPGFEPNRFVRDPRRPPGRGTHPDLEHFSPFG